MCARACVRMCVCRWLRSSLFSFGYSIQHQLDDHPNVGNMFFFRFQSHRHWIGQIMRNSVWIMLTRMEWRWCINHENFRNELKYVWGKSLRQKETLPKMQFSSRNRCLFQHRLSIYDALWYALVWCGAGSLDSGCGSVRSVGNCHSSNLTYSNWSQNVDVTQCVP